MNSHEREGSVDERARAALADSRSHVTVGRHWSWLVSEFARLRTAATRARRTGRAAGGTDGRENRNAAARCEPVLVDVALLAVPPAPCCVARLAVRGPTCGWQHRCPSAQPVRVEDSAADHGFGLRCGRRLRRLARASRCGLVPPPPCARSVLDRRTGLSRCRPVGCRAFARLSDRRRTCVGLRCPGAVDGPACPHTSLPGYCRRQRRARRHGIVTNPSTPSPRCAAAGTATPVGTGPTSIRLWSFHLSCAGPGPELHVSRLSDRRWRWSLDPRLVRALRDRRSPIVPTGHGPTDRRARARARRLGEPISERWPPTRRSVPRPQSIA